MSNLKEQIRKKLVSQTSDQLFSKLKAEKLFGVSKDVAIEILNERKSKGKFNEDLSSFSNAVEKKVETKSEKKEKEVNNQKVVKEKKERAHSKLALSFPDFKLKFKKGQEVNFTPFRSDKELTGVIISSYPYQPKGGEVREDVRIRVSDKVYVKKGSLINVIK